MPSRGQTIRFGVQRVNAMDKRIERAYYKHCAGIQINIMDIGKVFEHGRRQIEQEGLDDEALGR